MNSFTYTHDAVGNRVSMTDPTGLHTYQYDPIYQLLQAVHPVIPAEQFSYDPVGNRQNANFNEVDGFKVNTTYTYDYENRLTRVQYPGMDAQYKYDPFGRRIEKNVNGQITRYVYDGDNILNEYDGANNIKGKYVFSLAIDDPLSVDHGGSVYYYHKDGLGSVTELTNSVGSVIKKYRYNSFGEIYSQSGSLFQPFTFTGREYDSESGLYYYRARYYDPAAGIFIGKDPIGFKGGINNYIYIGNNPVNFLDPNGESAKACVRRWAYTPIAYFLWPPRHCYVEFSDGTTLSYDGKIGPDALPNTLLKGCHDIKEDKDKCSNKCTDICIKEAMQQCTNQSYNLITHNCCDCVRTALTSCGCKVPLEIKLTNWGL